MIGYITLGTNDKEKAATFYDQLLADQGVKQLRPNDRICLWAKQGSPMFGISVPYDGQPATPGNGTMIALSVDSTEKVDQLYARAIELGATDEGAAGPRGDGRFYGGYFRDLDGNKIVVFNSGS